jgi:hexosaminidase
MGFLQDAGAWILMPREVVVLASEDGVSYREVGRATSTVPATETAVVTRDFAVDVAPLRARYVRVHVAGAGPLPAGHASAGEPSWFFADEIVIEP